MYHSRLVDRLLAGAIPRADRAVIVGDLAEEYAIRIREGSRVRAFCWYWNQVVRAVPWLLWIQVRRGGFFGALRVALAACVVQAGVELFAASVIRTFAPPGVITSVAIGLVVVLVSMFVVSFVAARVRPGAGIVLTVLATVAVLARSLAMDPSALGLTHLAAALAAPSAALAGAALATARAGNNDQRRTRGSRRFSPHEAEPPAGSR